MNQTLFAMGAIVVFGAIYVVIPLVAEAFRHWRAPRRVPCPQKGTLATVSVEPWRAALTSIVRRPTLRVKDCSFWPECSGCDEGCRSSL
jgi:hypothetical protein